MPIFLHWMQIHTSRRNPTKRQVQLLAEQETCTTIIQKENNYFVLIPEYICNKVIIPFLDNGCICLLFCKQLNLSFGRASSWCVNLHSVQEDWHLRFFMPRTGYLFAQPNKYKFSHNHQDLILEAQSMKKSKVKHKIHTYYVVKKKQNLLRDAKVICFWARHTKKPWKPGCRKSKKFCHSSRLSWKSS